MRNLCFLLCLFIVLTFFGGCSSSPDKESDNPSRLVVNSEISFPEKEVQAKQWNESSLLPGVEQIVKKGTLTVAMIQNDVPVFCETSEDGTVTGIDVQWAQNIANSLGVKLKINRDCDTYDKLTEILIGGDVDLVISTYSLTTDRAAYIRLSEPYLTSRLGVMVNKEELVRNKIEKNPMDYMKSNPIKLAAIKGSSHVKTFSEMFPNARIIEMNTYEEMCQAVRNDDIFGYICGELQFVVNYSSDPELALYTQVFAFSDALEHYCIGVSPNNPDLLQFVNTHINTSKATTVKDFEDRCKEKFSLVRKEID